MAEIWKLYGKLRWGTCGHSVTMEVASWSEITPSVHHGTNEQCPRDTGLVMAARE